MNAYYMTEVTIMQRFTDLTSNHPEKAHTKAFAKAANGRKCFNHLPQIQNVTHSIMLRIISTYVIFI